MRGGPALRAALPRALPLGAGWHRDGFCHPDRDSPTWALPGGPGAPSGTPHSPGGLPEAGSGTRAGAGAAPRSPLSNRSVRPRAALSRRPLSGCLSPSSQGPLAPTSPLFIRGAPPEPGAAGTGQRRRTGGAGAAAPSAWEERAAAGAERRRGEGRI